MSYLKKIHLVGAELFNADGRTYIQTDMMKPTVALANFANARNDHEVIQA
jgi:hypothetical protein